MQIPKMYEELMSSVENAVIAELTKIKPVVLVGAMSYRTSEPEDESEFTRLCDLAVRGISDPIFDQGYETVFLGVLELALRFVNWVCEQAASKSPEQFGDPSEYSMDKLLEAVQKSEFLGSLFRYCVYASYEKFGSAQAAEEASNKIAVLLNNTLRDSRARLAARVLLSLIVLLAQMVFHRALRPSSHGQRVLASGLISSLNSRLRANERPSDQDGFVKPTKGEA